ncbi:hypothetical protein LK994_11215 [Ferruginibacter lapsinanis]|uniref:GldM family protein n=1 Tax=Ferruginibacter lapsinanis TaxID=563172 RepID=UPI001E349CA6|nr:GldM family protein [Ferruginibacter lapsinanis]UEG49200.1 hypothetical protein LK994_11215 [Ferruginibacter lapsinanis]
MKTLLLFSVVSFCTVQADSQLAYVEKPESVNYFSSTTNNPEEDPDRVLQLGTDGGRMSAVVFKNQEYCRAELERFDFDAHFSVVGATVYFSGANFKNLEKGTITSSSLKPIKELMLRCVPGSIVVFDDVKVIGPDKKLRTIPGATYILY